MTLAPTSLTKSLVNLALLAGREIMAIYATDFSARTKSDLTPVHMEARDDRYVAAFDRLASQKPEFSVAYVVRAVTPGRYVHPGAAVEDMYRPDRFGRGASGTVEVLSAR